MMYNTQDADLHDVVVVGAAHVVEHGVELIIPAQPGVVAALCKHERDYIHIHIMPLTVSFLFTVSKNCLY